MFSKRFIGAVFTLMAFAFLFLLPVSIFVLFYKLIALYKPKEASSIWSGLLGNTGFWFVCLILGSAAVVFVVFSVIRSGRLGQGLLDFNPALKLKYEHILPYSEALPDLEEVILLGETKKLALEAVDILLHPERYETTNARPIKGTLLIGPTGNGKTLLIKAIAKLAGAHFFSVSGAAINQVYAGLGSLRIQEMFERAAANAPSIIFIDELDAVGKQRRTGNGPPSGSADDGEQTLNQILHEMDGMLANPNVIVFAATNRFEMLDAALVRPGRFEKHVYIDNPTEISRLRLLESTISLREIPTELPKGYLELAAHSSHGFSGASIVRLVNEAAIIAAQNKSDVVLPQHFESAKYRVLLGNLGGLPRFGEDVLYRQYVTSMAVRTVVAYCLSLQGPLSEDEELQEAVNKALPEDEQSDSLGSDLFFQISTTRIAKGKNGLLSITPGVFESGYQPSLRRVLFEVAINLAPYVANNEIYKVKRRYAGDGEAYEAAERLARHAISSWQMGAKTDWDELFADSENEADKADSDDDAAAFDFDGTKDSTQLIKTALSIAKAVLDLASTRELLSKVVSCLEENHSISFHRVQQLANTKDEA